MHTYYIHIETLQIYTLCNIYIYIIPSFVHGFTDFFPTPRPSLGEDDLQGLWRSFDKEKPLEENLVLFFWESDFYDYPLV